MRPQVIVVEGKNDAFKIKSLFKDVIVITTNGSAIDIDQLNLIKKLDQKHDIILFLDPDHAGDRIRRILSKHIKNVYHAFIDQEKAVSKSKKKIGVEHADDETLLNALNCIRKVNLEITSDITYDFLFQIGLLGTPFSKEKRKELSNKLNLGSPNGKTLYHRLRMFNINQKDVLEVL
jgi:ribonuclease M5